MPIPRSIASAASAAIALATALAVVLPAQAGLAATHPLTTAATDAATRPAQPQPARQRMTPTAVAVTAPVEPDDQDPSAEEDDSSDDEGAGAVPIVDGTDATDEDGGGAVPIVDGTDAVDADVLLVDDSDAVGDDSDVLADDPSSSSAGSTPAVRGDRTSGRWARVALPTAVRATPTGASRVKVTWRAAAGGAPAQQYAVELRARGSVLRTTTFPKARSATLWGLLAGKRYTVTVTEVGSDGTRRAAVGTSVRAPAAVPPKRATASTKAASGTAAKRSQPVRPR